MPRSVTPIITCRRQHHTRHVSPGQLCLMIYVQADCGQRLFFSTPTPPCLVLPDQQSDMGSGASDRTLRSNLKSVVAMQLPPSKSRHVWVQALQDNTEAPQLPASYPAMVLLALVPPLFFSIIDKRLDDYQAAAAGAPTAGAE